MDFKKLIFLSVDVKKLIFSGLEKVAPPLALATESMYVCSRLNLFFSCVDFKKLIFVSVDFEKLIFFSVD